MTEQEHRRQRIIAIATRIVTGMVESGMVEKTEEAIKAAMPEAVDTARAAYDAAVEFTS